jgi:hypothetical protein
MLWAVVCTAGPKEFGLTQLHQALADRNLETKIVAELGTDPPETFQIEPSPAGSMVRITGGDLRGLMYGLIEAAEQIRATGKLARAHGSPTIALRGVRLPLSDSNRFTPGGWREFMETLALARFNRVTVVLDHFPEGLEQRSLQSLAQIASSFGVDFILGLPVVEAEPLSALLAACTLVRGVEIPRESLPAAQRAQREAGRLISIDLPDVTRNALHGIAVRALVSISIDTATTAELIRRRLAQVDPTTGFRLEVPSGDDSAASVYRLWGRLAYDLSPPTRR